MVNFGIKPEDFTENLILEIFGTALEILNPTKVVHDALIRDFGNSKVPDRVAILAFGKASIGMIKGALGFFSGSQVKAAAVVPKSAGAQPELYGVRVFSGTHPIPTEESVSAAKNAIDYCFNNFEPEMALVLISGGGSSLFEIPEDWTSIEEINRISKCLMDNGANIHELNSIRRLMSKVKGGKLNDLIKVRKKVGYIISDVPGDNLDFIASGPLTPPSQDHSREVIQKFIHVCPDLSKVESHLLPRQIKGMAQAADAKIVLKNGDFVACIYNQMADRGFETVSLGSSLTGDVENFSEFIVSFTRGIFAKKGIPFFFVGGGETTSEVKGNGKGGRNCELAIRVMRKFSLDEN